MALKRVSVQAEEKKATKDNHKIVKIRGNVVEDYNEANKESKDAADRLKVVLNTFKPMAIEEYIKTQIGTVDQDSSVILEDATGARVMVTSQNKYSSCSVEAAEAVFKQVGVDINDALVEKVELSFDNNIFMKDGEFNEELFKAFQEQMEIVANSLGIKNPVSTSKKVTAKPTFHAQRWTMKNKKGKTLSVEDQALISSVVTNTVTLSPK